LARLTLISDYGSIYKFTVCRIPYAVYLRFKGYTGQNKSYFSQYLLKDMLDMQVEVLKKPFASHHHCWEVTKGFGHNKILNL